MKFFKLSARNAILYIWSWQFADLNMLAHMFQFIIYNFVIFVVLLQFINFLAILSYQIWHWLLPENT